MLNVFKSIQLFLWFPCQKDFFRRFRFPAKQETSFYSKFVSHVFFVIFFRKESFHRIYFCLRFSSKQNPSFYYERLFSAMQRLSFHFPASMFKQEEFRDGAVSRVSNSWGKKSSKFSFNVHFFAIDSCLNRRNFATAPIPGFRTVRQ